MLQLLWNCQLYNTRYVLLFYQKFFCFKNDRVTNNTDNSGNSNNTSNDGNSANYQVKITANGGLNIRTGASTSSNRIGV